MSQTYHNAGKYKPYRSIGPSALENHWGKQAALISPQCWTAGRIDFNTEGVLCLRAHVRRELIEVGHGHSLSIKIREEDSNSYREYIFIDASD